MKNFILLTFIILFTVVFTSCNEKDKGAESAVVAEQDSIHAVQIKAGDYTFDMPEEVPSGWTTFRLDNQGEEIHEIYMVRYRLPEGVTKADLLEAFKIPRQDMEWRPEEWTAIGGVGSVSQGMTGQSTMYMEPGTYYVSCHVPMQEGTAHWRVGMEGFMTVTEEESGLSRPESDFEVRVDSTGSQTVGDIKTGKKTIRFKPEDHAAEVVLFQLDPEKTAEDVEKWMPDEAQTPPGTLLEGIEPLGIGQEAFFTVTLEPGNYA